MVRERVPPTVEALFDQHVARHGHLPASLKSRIFDAHANGRGSLTVRDLTHLGSALFSASLRTHEHDGEDVRKDMHEQIGRANQSSKPALSLVKELTSGLNALASKPLMQRDSPSESRSSPNGSAPSFRDILATQWYNDAINNGTDFWKEGGVFDRKKEFDGFELHGSASTVSHGGRQAGVLLMGKTGAGKSRVWGHLVFDHDHHALVDDCTNVILTDDGARIHAPPTDDRFRESDMLTTIAKNLIMQRKGKPSAEEHARYWHLGPNSDGRTFRGKPILQYPEFPMDPAPRGRQLRYVFFLTPRKSTKVRMREMSRDEFAHHVSRVKNPRVFPTRFGDERTRTTDSVKELKPDEKKQIALSVYRDLASRGVKLMQVQVPASAQGTSPGLSAHRSEKVAKTIQRFLKDDFANW